MQTFNEPYQSPEQGKKSKTWLIIVIVLLVVLCCCVATILILYFWLGDLILEQIEPYLMPLKLLLV